MIETRKGWMLFDEQSQSIILRSFGKTKENAKESMGCSYEHFTTEQMRKTFGFLLVRATIIIEWEDSVDG